MRGSDMGRNETARVRQGAVARLNYRDARKKSLTGSSGPPATMAAGGRRHRWLNCHAPAKRTGHVPGPDGTGSAGEPGYERSGYGRGRPIGPRSGHRQARDLRRSAASGPAAPGVAHKLDGVGQYVRSPPAMNSALAERGTHEAKGDG